MIADVLLHATTHDRSLRGFAGEFEEQLGDMAALDTVAAEQRLRLAEVARDQRKLPGEIERVLHAGVHTLTACRAVDVRGVSGNEDAA